MTHLFQPAFACSVVGWAMFAAQFGVMQQAKAQEPAAAAQKVDAKQEDAQKADLLTPGKQSDGKYVFRYLFKPGEVVRWEIVQQFHVDTTVQGTTQQARTYSKSVKAWRVEEVDPTGGVTFNHIVESTLMWQELTGRARVSWDSTKDESAPVGFEEVAKSLNKVLYIVKMDNRGNIQNKLVKYQAPNTDTATADKQMTMPLPAEPVSVGHVWHLPYQIRLQLEDKSYKTFEARDRFLFESVKDDVAVIKVETQILTPVRDPALEAQLVQRGGVGEVHFDLAHGRMVRQRIDVDKTAIGFRGQASSIHFTSRFTETLSHDASPSAAPPATAEKPSTEETTTK